MRKAGYDRAVLLALNDKAAPNRMNVLREWFESYKVFQGIDGHKRDAITGAVLQWADNRDQTRDLTTVDALTEAHAELMADCTRAFGEPRDFTSLASKGLWLCYPDSVPMYDNFTVGALTVFTKPLEMDCAPGREAYRKFVHTWKALYQRYETALNEVPMGEYLYRVQLFDVILWLIGQPSSSA